MAHFGPTKFGVESGFPGSARILCHFRYVDILVVVPGAFEE